LKKKFVTFGELFLKPSDTIRLVQEGLTSKYCRQLLIMSMLVVLNNLYVSTINAQKTHEYSIS